jgi:hypothetical protein
MKTKTVLLGLAICALICGITSCKKDGDTVDTSSKEGIVYVIDITQKTIINEILYLEDKFLWQ